MRRGWRGGACIIIGKFLCSPLIVERDTSQRRAIRRIFEEIDRPLSPQEVLEEAQAHAVTLGIATVYRNLKALVESGWLAPVGLPGEPDRYEVAGKGHHHHFRCRTCERVYEVDGCPGGIQGMVPEGFRLESHEVVLYGLCEKCVAPKAGRQARPKS